MQCYVDGTEAQTIPFGHSEAEQIDGPLALRVPDGIALFASHDESQMPGGVEIRSLEVHDRALQLHELARLHASHELVSKWQCVFCDSTNQWDQTACLTCGEHRTDLDPAALAPDEDQDLPFVDRTFQYVLPPWCLLLLGVVVAMLMFCW